MYINNNKGDINNMNKLSITAGLVSLTVLGAVGLTTINASAMNGVADHTGTGSGSANGYGRQSSIESRASVVGMTADQLEEALQTKTMSQVALDQDMTEEDFQVKMNEAANARWIARGLSSEEIAQRIADREARQATNEATDHEFGDGTTSNQGSHGYGQNR
jgi:preprotein translocase subunit SecF